MKPMEAITLADEMKPNMMSTENKMRFLNEIEARVHGEIIMKHEHTTEQETCPVYTIPADPSAEQPDMLVPDKYAMLYVYWIESRIDELNQEMTKFNNDRTLFQAEWDNFFSDYIGGHMPLTAMTHFRV